MATEVDKLIVRIEADMQDLKKSLDTMDRDIKRSTTAAAASFKNLGAAIRVAASAVIVLQLVRAGKAAVDLAGDVAEMQSKSKVVFGAFRDDVVANLSEFGNAVGRSSHELEAMASSIQDTFVPMGFARGEAADLSVQLTKLAVDVASFNNASDTATMEAFQSALVGNHETVRRFGVVITEATLKQELLRMGIQRTGDEVTNAEKVQARLNLILAGTTDAQGDAARTADSYANQVKALSAEFETLAVEIGQELLPAATELVALFRDGLKHVRAFLVFTGQITEFGRDAEGTRKKIAKLNEEIAKLQKLQKERENQSLVKGLTTFVLEGGVTTEEQIALLQNTIDKLNDQLRAQEAVEQAEKDLLLKKEENTKKTEDTNEASKNYTKTIADLKQKLLMAKLELNGYSKAEVDALKSSGLLKTATADLEIATIELSQEYEDLEALVSELTEAENALAEKEDAAAAKKKALADAAREYAQNMQKLKDLIQQTIAPTTTLEEEIAALELHLSGSGPKIDGAREALEKLKDELYMQNPVIQAFSDGIDKMATDLSTALADAVANGKMDMESLRDAFSQTLRQMLADAMRAQIIRPLISGMFSAVGGSIDGPLGTFISSIGQTKATGGPVMRGMPTLVGERGPELFVPQGAGSIVNAATTRGMGGGVTVNQTFAFSANGDESVKKLIHQAAPQIAKMTEQGIMGSRRRGGQMKAVFG